MGDIIKIMIERENTSSSLAMIGYRPRNVTNQINQEKHRQKPPPIKLVKVQEAEYTAKHDDGYMF
jgi:hypothetical protein